MEKVFEPYFIMSTNYPTNLTDQQWAVIKTLLPPQRSTGRPRQDDRLTFNAILYVLRTGCRWCDLPRDLGDNSTANRRLLPWQRDGTWEQIWFSLLGQLNSAQKLEWTQALLDGTFVFDRRQGIGFDATAS